MSKQLFYSFFKKLWKALFSKCNIEVAWQAIGIGPYNLNMTLAICTKKSSSIHTKKLHLQFVPKTPFSYHAIQQLVMPKKLDIKNTYIQAMLRSSEKLATKIDGLEFEKKRLIGALKVETQRRNKGKRLYLFDEKDNSP